MTMNKIFELTGAVTDRVREVVRQTNNASFEQGEDGKVRLKALRPGSASQVALLAAGGVLKWLASGAKDHKEEERWQDAGFKEMMAIEDDINSAKINGYVSENWNGEIYK